MVFDWLKGKKKTTAVPGPDFSDVDSQAKAEALHEAGTLEKLLLLPADFGGSDSAPNVVYVPVGIAALKDSTDHNVIAPLVASGKITKYSATPEYQGKSFVPIAIKIEASDPGQFASNIKIWGDALLRAE